MTPRDESRGHRLVAVTLDERSIGWGNPEQENERRVAIHDLIEGNRFGLPGLDRGPYRLAISLQEGRLVFAVATDGGHPVVAHGLSLKPFRSVLRDYLLVCDSYYVAVRAASPKDIEAIDMGRRALHNEGAALLGERLRGKIEADPDTLRRMFTLMAALHWRG